MSQLREHSIEPHGCEYGHPIPEDHCPTCDSHTCVDGRTLEVVNQYASTCDCCGELTHHHNLTMDPVTQLGYCDICVKEESIVIPEAVQ